MKRTLGKWVVRIYEPTGSNDIYSDYFDSRYAARTYARNVKAGLRDKDKVEIFQDLEGFFDVFGGET
jgi:hypothetical protein